MQINDHYFHLEINRSDEPLESLEPDHFIYESTGTVVALDPSDDEIVAGKFRVYYVDIVSAINDGTFSVFNVFDSYSETVDYYGAIFEPESLDINEKLLRALKCDPFFGNVLIIDRLEILPAFRLRSLGLVVMRKIIQRFGSGTSIIAIKPFPLQFEDSDLDVEWKERMALTNFDKNIRRTTTRLKKHYRKLGFAALPATPFMFLETEQELPSVDQLTA